MSSTSDPTPQMIDRAVAWRKFVKLLDTYFSEAATTLEQRSEQAAKLANVVNEKDVHSIVPYFAPRGKSGVNDVLPTITSMHEAEAKASAKASKLIGTQLRAELEKLAADIENSIEDFRGYSASFTGSETAGTGHTSTPGTAKGESTKEAYAGNSSHSTADLLSGPLKPQLEQYQEAVAAAAAHKSPKVDPYILKLSIDKKLAKLSKGQNRLSDSYAYTQDASKEVDAGVTDRLQGILGRYADAVGNQGQATLEGSSALLGGFLAHPKLYEYHHFLQSSKAPKAFQNEQASRPQQQQKEQAYPDEDSVYSKALRTGELERRTKILHSYSPGEYVLTPQSLIEMKNGLPVWSLDLIGAKLLEDHKAAEANQFVLQARQHGSSSGKLHTFVFRAKVAQNWRRELAAITAGEVPPSLEAIARAQNRPGAAAAGTAPTGADAARGPAPAYDDAAFVNAPDSTAGSREAARNAGASHTQAAPTASKPGAGATSGPHATSKAAEPASAVAGAGGAATSRPHPADRLDSTDAIPPSSKYNLGSESPKPSAGAGGLGPEPTEPFPKIDRSAPTEKSGATDSANPFGEPPSNASLTGVPVAGAAGAAAASEAPYFGHDAPAGKASDHPPTLDPAAGGPGAGSFAGGKDRELGKAAPFDLTQSQLSDPVDQVDQSKDPRFAGGDSGATDREFGKSAPFDYKEGQLSDPVNKVNPDQDPRFAGASGIASGAGVAGAAGAASAGDRDLGKSAPFDYKESQLQHPVDKVNAGQDPRFAAAGAGGGGGDRDLGKSAPFDYKESQLQHPIDKVNAGQDPRFAAAGAAGTGDRDLGKSAPFDYKESQLQHPIDKVNAGQDPRFAASGASTGGREYGKPAPYDFKEGQIDDPVDKVIPGQGLAGADRPRGAAAGTVAGGAAGFNSRSPYDYRESQLSQPVDRVPEQGVQGNRSAAGAGAAATSHLPGAHHDSDSDVSETEQGFNDYFDEDDAEPRIGTLAWQAKHDMQVFNRPVGYASVDDPRPEFAQTAEDQNDDASTWSYDLKHKNALNTFRDDRNFKPADADLPVQTERRLTNTHHKLERPIVDPMRTDADALDDPDTALQRRRSSVNAHTSGKLQRSPSRRATGSYGDENELKPLSGVTSHEKAQALSGDSALVFGEGLPKTTSGGKF